MKIHFLPSLGDIYLPLNISMYISYFKVGTQRNELSYSKNCSTST